MSSPSSLSWAAILPQRICVDLYLHHREEKPPLSTLLSLTYCQHSDVTPLLSHTQTDSHLAAMVHVSPDRFRRGDLLWLFYDSDRLVHVAWTRYDHLLDLTYELGKDALWLLPEDSVVIYDCYTLHAERGKRYYPRALATLVRATSATTLWIYTLRTNKASRNGIVTAGFTWERSHCRCRWPLAERLLVWAKRKGSQLSE